jgi:hypothetical protein
VSVSNGPKLTFVTMLLSGLVGLNGMVLFIRSRVVDQTT